MNSLLHIIGRSRFNWLIVFAFLLVTLTEGAAQRAQFQFFPRSEHLSSSYFNAIQQDQDGFIWVLGNRADRYDGYNFVPAKGADSGLPNFFTEEQYVLCSGAVIHKREDHFLVQKLHNWETDSIPFADVLPEHAYFANPFVHELVDGQILFPYIDSLSNLFNFLRLEEDNQLVQYWSEDGFSEKPDYNCFPLLSDHKGHFYTIDQYWKHILLYNAEGKLINKIPFTGTPYHVRNIALYGGDNLLFTKDESIYEWNRTALELQVHPATAAASDFKRINDVKEDKDGNLWFCGADRNLLFYDVKKQKSYDFTDELMKLIPRRVALHNMTIDRSGTIWIRTYIGIIKVVPMDNLFETYFTNKTAICDGYCSFRGITEGDEGEIYASCYGGIMKIDRTRKTTEILEPDRALSPRGLSWKDGKLLLNDGSLLDPKTGQTDSKLKPVRDYLVDFGEVATDGNGIYWNNHHDSIFVLNENNRTAKWSQVFSIPAYKGRAELHFGTTSGKLWVGDGNRIFAYNTKGEQLNHFIPFSDENNIATIYEDGKGLLWFGTENGLVNFDPVTAEIVNWYTSDDGLSYNTVTAILPEGDSCLWVSTYLGLSRLNIEEEQFLNFYEQDGLSDNKFNRTSAYKAKDGQLFFGGYQGVNAFYPETVMKAYNHKIDQGELVLSSFSRTDEKEQRILIDRHDLNQKRLECYPWNKVITFEFSLNDYKNTPQNKYSYFLEGYENDWSTPTEYNFAKYPSLPAGDYVFRAKALEANGSWNPNELSVSLTVYPPWWQTSLAYSGYCFLVIFVLFVAYRLLRYRWDLKNKFRTEQNEARRLKELDAFKSRLFTNITHEFRTPLTVILGMAGELQEGFKQVKEEPRKEAFGKYTNMIQRNGESLLQLVNRLLDLSKLQHKSYKLELQNDNVIPLLNYLTSVFETYANQQNVLLSFNSALPKLEMDYDPHFLQQLMTNLISNAIKFTPSGGQIDVRLSLGQLVEMDSLLIEVEDTGIGIAPSKTAHIFDLFYQADGSSTRAGEGTGIGLAHTKELVDLVGGRISVKSELEKGTTFSVHLPIKNLLKKAEDNSAYKSSEIDGVSEDRSGQGLSFRDRGQRKEKEAALNLSSEIALENRPIIQDNVAVTVPKIEEGNKSLPLILLIEDNPDVLHYLKSCLADEYQIEFALNGQSGIEKALDLIPDVIISDVMMPVKDGFEVCSFLKDEEKTSHIPIILLTAKADVSSRLVGLEKGADAYLSKPFNKEELILRVAKLLDRQQRMTEYFKQKYQGGSLPLEEPSLESQQLKVEDAFLQKVNAILEKNFMDKDFGLPQLCQKLGLSRSQLFRKIKALTGEAPSIYMKNYRLQKAKKLLETTDLNVSEVAWKTGFGTLSHFSRSFQQVFGERPSTTSNQL